MYNFVLRMNEFYIHSSDWLNMDPGLNQSSFKFYDLCIPTWTLPFVHIYNFQFFSLKEATKSKKINKYSMYLLIYVDKMQHET